MTIEDKIAWMEKFGRMDFYCKLSIISDSDPYITWTPRYGVPKTGYNRTVRVVGDTNAAIHNLFDATRNRLYKLCQDLQDDTL